VCVCVCVYIYTYVCMYIICMHVRGCIYNEYVCMYLLV